MGSRVRTELAETDESLLMPEILKQDLGEIEIHRRRRQRNMNLSVRGDGSIRVSCNLRRSQREILDFVESCRDFIARRRQKIAVLEQLYPRPQYLSGETILWFGERLRLDVLWSWEERVSARRLGLTSFEIKAPLQSTPEQRREALIKLYKKEARPWFAARLQFFTGLMGVKPSGLSVRGQKTLWGSCSATGAISLNWKLLCCPRDVIDYVVVHELAHIAHRNHSARFWDFVGRFDPHYKEHRAYLKSVEPIIGRMF